MKNNEKLLNTIGEVRDEFVPDLKEKAPNRALKITLSAMCGLCAAFAVVGVGMKLYSRIRGNIPAQTGTGVPVATASDTGTAAVTDSTAERTETTLKQTETTAAEKQQGSFWEGYTAASCTPEKAGTEQFRLTMELFNLPVYVTDIGECASSPARSAEIGSSTLPVFRNLGVGKEDPAWSSQYLTEQQTKDLLLRAAEILNIPVTEIEGNYLDQEQTFLTEWTMNTGDGFLKASRDGTVKRLLTERLNGQPLTEFAKTHYGSLMGWEKTEAYETEISNRGAEYINGKVCFLYEASDDPVQALLNDSLSGIMVVCDEEADTVISVTLFNPLIAADYIGNYERIPEEEALRQFTEFDLHNAGAQDYPDIADRLEGGKVTADMIVKTEMLYLYNEHDEIIAPYYRFWVRSGDGEFTPFDYPAVRSAG